MTRRSSLVLVAALAGATVLLAVGATGLPWLNSSPTADARVDLPDSFPDPLPRYTFDPYGTRLAVTPPMGWNGYNRFIHDVGEDMVRAMALRLVTSGLKRAGYTYVNLDGGWDLVHRAPDGSLQPDPRKFPHGIRVVADYVHSLGLKFGIYTSVGLRNCAGTSAGSYGHFDQDAHTFAAWGIDYVKADWCWVPYRDYPNMPHAAVSVLLAKEFGASLAATGRSMTLDLNNWSDPAPSGRPRMLGNLWRTAPDIRDSYASMVLNFTRNIAYYPSAGPDRWNDPDMLEVGNGGMNATEYRAMFSLWAEMAAPLIAGNDLTRMSAETLAILGNRAVIAVDQDPLGTQGYPITNLHGLWVLSKPLANGDRSVVLFNQTSAPEVISTAVSAAGLAGSGGYRLTDLWTGAVRSTTGPISALVPAHGVVMLQVTPQT